MLNNNVIGIDKDIATVEYIFKVELLVKSEFNDLSTGYYDKEDRQWYGVEHIVQEKSFDCEVILEVNHQFDVNKNIFEVVSIESFGILYVS